MRFEWDPAKDEENQRKHGVRFSEAQILFESGVDPLEIYDELHSVEEERFIAIGPIPRGLVVVAWTERKASTIRIISARLATRHEQKLYRAHREGTR